MVAPSASIIRRLTGFAPCGRKMWAAEPTALAAYATPCPWLPVDDVTASRAAPPSRARRSAVSAPRSLNDAIGLTVSFLSQTSAPSARERSSERTSGVSGTCARRATWARSMPVGWGSRSGIRGVAIARPTGVPERSPAMG